MGKYEKCYGAIQYVGTNNIAKGSQIALNHTRFIVFFVAIAVSNAKQTRNQNRRTISAHIEELYIYDVSAGYIRQTFKTDLITLDQCHRHRCVFPTAHRALPTLFCCACQFEDKQPVAFN